MDSTEFFGSEAPAPDPQGYDRYGRYKLDADGTGEKAYTRATTLAKTLDDGIGLAIWGQRKAAKGVAMSPALTARAAATPLDDKKVWREILSQAEVKSGGDEKRDWGSAFHEFHERVPAMSDEEYAAQAVELRVTYERYRAELDRLGIEEVLTEFTCVNQQIGTAGKGDAIFKLADGRLVIGDRKTGRVVEYPHAPAVQFAVYANADTLITFDENGAASRSPMPEVDKTMALIVDITIGDETTAAVHVYEVDIWAGWYGALLAGQVRRWRNRKDLIRPYHPEFPPAERAQAAAAIEITQHPEAWAKAPVRTKMAQQGPVSREMTGEALPENQAWFENATPAQAPPVEPADRPDANSSAGMSATAKAVLGIGPAIGTGDAVQPPHAGTHPAWSSKEQAVIALDSKGERALELSPGTRSVVTEQTSNDVDALLAHPQLKTKAAMQEAGRRVGLTNLSRTRANLAKDMVAHPAWPSLRTAMLSSSGVSPATPLPGRDEPESFSPVVSNAPEPVPPDPEPTFPQQLPTPSESAAAQANPFTKATPAVEPVKTTEDELAERIAVATSTDDLAKVWEDARDAGLGWPPRLHQAATIRAKSLNQ
jgi:hypothetical protein